MLDSQECQRVCMFCNSCLPLSCEHIIPQWVSRLFDKNYFSHSDEFIRSSGELNVDLNQIYAGIDSYSFAEIKNIKLPWRNWTVRSVCEKCNNGWMSQLEEAVRPAIAPCIANPGKFKLLLSSAQKESIARWAFVKALLISVAATGGFKKKVEESYFPEDFYKSAFLGEFPHGVIIELFEVSSIRFGAVLGGDTFIFPRNMPAEKLLFIARMVQKKVTFKFGRLLFRLTYLPPVLPVERL